MACYDSSSSDSALVLRITEGMVAGDFSEVFHLFREMRLAEPTLIWSPSSAALEKHPIQFLLGYWQGLSRGKSLPLACDVDPVEMKGGLGYVLLMDVLEGGWDFRFRVFGSHIAEYTERDETGSLISELPDSSLRDFIVATNRACIQRREPLFTRHEPRETVETRHWDRFVLPLANRGGDVVRLLVGKVPGEWRPPANRY